MTTEEMDAVPTEQLFERIVTLEEQREWFEYSLLVLHPRAVSYRRKIKWLMGNPFFRWYRARRELAAVNERREAILTMRAVLPEVTGPKEATA